MLIAVAIWSAASDTLLAKAGGDGPVDSLATRVFAAKTYLSGALPLWNPHIFSGMSNLAIVQSAPFYPLNVLLYVLLPSTIAFNLAMVLHLLLLLGCLHAYFRLITDHEEAAWLGAVTFTFSGFVLLNLESISVFNSMVWVPPLFYCVEKWIRTREWRFAALGGVCVALQLLAGWPQMALLSAIYVGIYVLTALPEEHRRMQLFAGLLVMAAISAGLSVIQILPTLEFKPFSSLAVLPYSHFVSNAIPPKSLVTLLFPYLMGADSTTYHRVEYMGPAQMLVSASYMGILPLMLGAGALAFSKRSRHVRFAICSGLVATAMACAPFTLLAPILYRLPFYNFFRDHRVNDIFLVFAVSILATYFAGHLDDELSVQLRRRLSLAVPLGFVALAAILLIFARMIIGSMNRTYATLHPMWLWRLHQSMRIGNPDMIVAWLTILASGALFWLWMRNPRSVVIARAAIALVVVDLLWFGLTDQPHFSRGHANPAEQATLDTVKRTANGEPFRAMSLTREYEFIKPNLNGVAGIDDIFGYSALVPRQYGDLLSVDIFQMPQWPELMANNAILSLLNTRFIVASGDEAKAVQTRFLNASSASATEADQSGNLLDAKGWVALKPNQAFNQAEPFQCSMPPCGMQQAGLTIPGNSVYQLRFTAQSVSQIADLNIIIARHNDWRPLQSFDLSNAQLSPNATPYVDIYVSGSADELVDLRFSTQHATPLHVSDVSLSRVGMLANSDAYREIAKHDDIIVVENKNVLPRAFFVSKAPPAR